MIKKLLLPFQIVLLNRKMCVGCTTPLDKSGNRSEYTEHTAMVQCKCKRRYIHDLRTDTYRRATRQEEKLFLEKTRRDALKYR